MTTIPGWSGGDIYRDIRTKEERLVQEIVEFFGYVKGPFRAYPNPMRSDGVFVGQDKEIEPYPNVRSMSGPIYPATPQGAKKYPMQVSQEIAEKVLEILNVRGDPQRKYVLAASRWQYENYVRETFGKDSHDAEREGLVRRFTGDNLMRGVMFGRDQLVELPGWRTGFEDPDAVMVMVDMIFWSAEGPR